MQEAGRRLAAQVRNLKDNQDLQFNVLDLDLTAEEIRELGSLIALANQVWSFSQEVIVNSWKREDNAS